MSKLKEGGLALILDAPSGRDPMVWREGKVVTVRYTREDWKGMVEVHDACGRKTALPAECLKPIELPTCHESLWKAHHYLTRTRSKGGWRIQMVWGDLPDEVMAQEIAKMLEGYADMVAELERLRSENQALRSCWDISPEVQDDLVRRLW